MKDPIRLSQLGVLVAILACALALAPRAQSQAAPLKVAVFPFEFDDTSLQGAMQGPRYDEKIRLARLAPQLRDRLTGSGRYVAVDVAPVAAAAEASNLRSCGGCDIGFARKVGAQIAVVGWVQKVSNLILNINVVMHDVDTEKEIGGGSVDIRGNTDESWTRGVDYLARRRLLAAPQ
jgi:Protein of unknown function (DUF2380)